MQINTMYHHNLLSNWISFLFFHFPACKSWRKKLKNVIINQAKKKKIMRNNSFYTRLVKRVKMKDSAKQQKEGREKKRGVTTHLYRISCRGNVHAVMQWLAASAVHGRNCDTDTKLWAAFNSLYTPRPNIYKTGCLKRWTQWTTREDVFLQSRTSTAYRCQLHICSTISWHLSPFKCPCGR